MKIQGKLSLLLLFWILTGQLALAQSQISVASVTACPNQVMTFTATWNNVGNITYTLFSPPVNTPGVPVPATFTLVSPSQVPTAINYTLAGTGTSISGVVTSTAYFSLSIIPPGAMSITNTINYCYGDNASFFCPPGGTQYTVSGGCFNGTSSSNIITFPLSTPGCTSQYTVTSLIAGCTTTGVTQVNVAPNNQISISSPTSVCQEANVTLTCSLVNGSDFEWLNSSNVSISNGQAANLNLVTINDAGVYTATANINFNGIKCPKTATTQVNVVQTSPVLATASPSTTICQGGNLNLSAGAGIPVNGWTWNGPASFYSTLQNPVIAVANPMNSGNYTVTALYIGSFLTCTKSAVIGISVIPVTQPVISLPSNVCQSQTTSVTMSATAGPNVQSFEWIGPCLPPGTVGQSVLLPGPQPNCSGTYYVNAKFSSFPTCISTASAVLNVIPVNTVTVIPPGEVCTPINANLQANAFGANLFTWVGPNGFSTPGANVIVYYPTLAASGIYTVTAYFGGGNLTCTNTNTVQLTVKPVLNFTLVPRQQKCYNEAVSVEGPAGATGYTWTSSTGFTSNSKDISFAAIQPKNAGSYTLNVSLGPCKTSGETVIDVLSPITWTLRPSSKTICRGDTITMEGGVTSGSENYAYYWNPGVYLDSPNGPKKTVAPLGTVLYNLIVHDIACPNFTVAHTVSITVNQPPSPQIELNPGSGCAPLVLYLNSNTGADAFVTTYDFGGLHQVQGDNFYYALNEAGTYTMSIYSKGKNGCGGTYVYPYPIVVNPSPGADFYLNPEKPTTIDNTQFIATTTGPVTSYKWMFTGAIDPFDTSKVKVKPPGSDTTNIKDPIRLYEKAGTYPVMLIAGNESQCIDTVVKYIKVIDELQVFIPNSFTPNDDGINDVFNIKGIGMKSENYSMQIVSRWGVVVFSTEDINEGWNGKYEGEVCRDGSYIYNVKVVGANGEGRKEYSGYVILIK